MRDIENCFRRDAGCEIGDEDGIQDTMATYGIVVTEP